MDIDGEAGRGGAVAALAGNKGTTVTCRARVVNPTFTVQQRASSPGRGIKKVEHLQCRAEKRGDFPEGFLSLPQLGTKLLLLEDKKEHRDDGPARLFGGKGGGSRSPLLGESEQLMSGVRQGEQTPSLACREGAGRKGRGNCPSAEKRGGGRDLGFRHLEKGGRAWPFWRPNPHLASSKRKGTT